MTTKQRILNEIRCGKCAFKTQKEILQLPYLQRNKQAVNRALKELELDGSLVRDMKNRYCTPEQTGAFTGTLQGNARGFAFVIPDDKQRFNKDFFIPPRSVGGAYDGDKVLAAPVRGTDDEAYVIKILERGRKLVVGTFYRNGNRTEFYPDDEKLPEVFIPLSLSSGAKNGDKILCEITSYPEHGAPKGKTVEILGESGDFEVEELSLIRSHGLYESFPEDVISEAEKVADGAIVADGRRDLRKTTVFTIDGADTRDIDDAVSLEIIDGKYRLGVHIADVSSYVKYRSALDKEAYSRGTSVYFPDRVLPMLPKELSNGICSLNEGEDRLTLSCLMTFDENGKRLGYEICESIIRSRHKMTYSAVTAICEGDKKTCEDYSDIVGIIRDMQRLCLIMESNREKEGSVNLDVREAKIYVDENGEIVIPDSDRTISERIIEQFMISANEAVAEFLQEKQAPCLYRIHEKPSPEKAEALTSFLKDLGLNTNCGQEVTSRDFQRILKSAEGKPYYSVVNKVMLRCMQKARYSEQNLGHFGLASTCYCHFTSPIRRYPDLFVHRSLKAVMEKNAKALALYAKIAPEAGLELSERERIADETERDVDDLYKLVYMSDRIGEIQDAVISGVTEFGIFCELKNTVEGLVPLEVLPDDNYEFIAEKFTLKGSKHCYRLGDNIKICVDGCDFGRMRVMFSLFG